MNSKSTIQLIQECKLNKPQAQMSVYKLYCDAMYNVAFRILQNSYEAEDVVQESFLKAFNEIHKLKELKAFGVWLKKIVVTKSINLLKKEKNIQFVNLEIVEEKLEQIIEPIELTNLKVQEIFKTIKTLKPNYALLLTLHFIEGFDYDEIVDITEMSYSNCRTTISRAKKSLRKKLATHAEQQKHTRVF
jgi:RNA polymerase sigma-70 factor (ECF subfamily)